MKKLLEETISEMERVSGNQRKKSINDDLLARSAREAARINKMVFNEHLKVGFTEEQALIIVASILTNSK